MKQFIRKSDIILLTLLLALGLAASALLAVQGNDVRTDAKVVIKSGGSVYATYPLSEDKTLVVPAPKQFEVDAPAPNINDKASVQYDYYNIVIIDRGSVTVSEASCKNRVCVMHGSISRPGESIVCLPNRLVVSIEGGEGGGYDSITS